ncbi:DUF4097 family beta strand repeat-containing protein [Rhodohalobacter barkolensis]|uniref:DUF4097 domain-containing protein n=1 Tax=Rhodohalobacter barkolensis TaxID=2053187 RepID=A0A2N0VFY6_9BACT|nr:DUF4097 family beta strand repeat-containing protein [Rhodohalobacter barkolensis]PKD43099.1 hypothetical protein CWD77_10740 [Rhodohalobacter barkolensis]
MSHKILPFYLLLIALLFFTATSLYGQNEQDAYRVETFSTSNAPSVDIKTSGGSITLHGHESNEVKVLMYVKRGRSFLSPSNTDLSDYEIEVDISQTGDHITASAKREGRFLNLFRGGNNVSISFEVYAPEGTSVEGNTSGGSVSAENIHNSLILNTSGGSITASNASGNISLRTSGGSISLEDLSGSISAKTSGGSITTDRVYGTSDLSTSGGSVRISDSGGKLSASTSGGSIRADFSEFTDDIDLRTSGGSIRINIPPTEHFDLDLSATRVETELRNFTGRSERNSINGKIGNGGPKITARTSGGRITLNYI